MFTQTKKKKQKNHCASSKSTAYPASVLWPCMQCCSCRKCEAVTQTLEDRQLVRLLLLAADIQSSCSLATCLPWHYKRFAAHPVMTSSRHWPCMHICLRCNWNDWYWCWLALRMIPQNTVCLLRRFAILMAYFSLLFSTGRPGQWKMDPNTTLRWKKPGTLPVRRRKHCIAPRPHIPTVRWNACLESTSETARWRVPVALLSRVCFNMLF